MSQTPTPQANVRYIPFPSNQDVLQVIGQPNGQPISWIDANGTAQGNLKIGQVGPQGPQGNPGTNGTNGTNGATGPQGPVGPAGPAGANGVTSPQGRLTLTSGSPVMTADATAQTTIYYDSYVGQSVPIYNGTSWSALPITSNEISMGLDAGVPHVASGSLYDVFAVSNSGSLAIGIGPAWSSTTSRGTGAGTTQIHRQSASGFWTNQNSLTHFWSGASGATDLGPISADQATYLGTFYATANGQTGMQFKPAAANGGTNNILGLYNAYNSMMVLSTSRDSTSSWTYNSTTWRAANNSNSNRVTYVDGLQQSFIIGTYVVLGSSNSISAAGDPATGVALDSTTAAPGVVAQVINSNNGTGSTVTSTENFSPSLGLHYIQAMENAALNTVQFFGAVTSPTRQLQTLLVQLQM